MKAYYIVETKNFDNKMSEIRELLSVDYKKMPREQQADLLAKIQLHTDALDRIVKGE